MLTKEEIQILILMWLRDACDSADSLHRHQLHGQIRGLLAVLNDGRGSGIYANNYDSGPILDAAGIPWEPSEDEESGIIVPDAWLEERGARADEYGRVTHPKFGL